MGTTPPCYHGTFGMSILDFAIHGMTTPTVSGSGSVRSPLLRARPTPSGTYAPTACIAAWEPVLLIA